LNGLQNDLKDHKATITFKGSISAFGTQSASSPGVKNNITISLQEYHNIRNIRIRVFPESNTIKNVTVLQSSNSQQQQPSTSHASISPYAIQPILTEHLQQVGEFSSQTFSLAE
uniref:LSM14 domain-containing protein n=1 Tax=Gongylonema pulchrum TaxID=637853 RepID=A0A183D1S4_9BILA